MRILTLGAATALSLAFAAAPAPAATPYGGTPSVQLSATGDPAWDAEVAYSADGSAVIAWGRFDGTRYVAEAVRREADGTLGTVRTVATSDEPMGWSEGGDRRRRGRAPDPGRAGTASTTASRRAGCRRWARSATR